MSKATKHWDKIYQTKNHTKLSWSQTQASISLDWILNYTNKTDRHDITEILLKVALNTNKQTNISKRLESQIMVQRRAARFIKHEYSRDPGIVT
jgi:hypothetical protein